MVFWLIALLLVLLVAGLLAWPLLGRGSSQARANPDLGVYRDQLAEVESDQAKGVLAADEAERIRTEIARRILEADRNAASASPSGMAGRGATLTLSAILVLFLFGASAGVYSWIGADGAPDLPLGQRTDMAENAAPRPSQDEVETAVGDMSELADQADQTYRDLVAKLRETVAGRPDDLEGHVLLAQHEARLGNFARAHRAKARVIELKGDAAKASDYTDLAELMIIAAGGYVSPKAESALGKAIRLDPGDARARYYSGLDLAQNGRADLAYRIWRELLEQGPQDAPWIAPIRNQIAEVARLAGINAEPLPGPDANTIGDAANMDDAERDAMIRGMVAQLSERLASDGGSAAEWARLIRAYGVLGDRDKAAAALATAQKVFASDPAALAEIDRAARDAGTAE